MDESRVRAQQLLSLLVQSKHLSKQKCYGNNADILSSPERKGKRFVRHRNV